MNSQVQQLYRSMLIFRYREKVISCKRDEYKVQIILNSDHCYRTYIYLYYEDKVFLAH